MDSLLDTWEAIRSASQFQLLVGFGLLYTLWGIYRIERALEGMAKAIWAIRLKIGATSTHEND
jgi:hypothetical protein